MTWKRWVSERFRQIFFFVGRAAAFNQKVVFGFVPFLLKKVSFLGFEIKWLSLTQVPSYLHSFMCPGEPGSSYSSFVHCSWYQRSSIKSGLMLRVFSRSSYYMSQQFDPFLLQHLAEWTYMVFSSSSCFGISSSVNFFICVCSVYVRCFHVSTLTPLLQ